ncbi:MAG: hypothetical protein AABY16_04490, partial [Nanoarchaeota archaeon]
KKDQEYLRRLSEAVSERLQKQHVPVKAEPVYNLVSQSPMYKEIDFLRKRLPERIIYDLVSGGVADALRGRDPNITPKRVARAIYVEISEDEKYRKYAKELGKLLGEKNVGDIERMVKKELERRRGETSKTIKTLDEMVRRAAVYLPFMVAVGFLLKGFISASVTGAVIGSGGTADLNVLFGIGFFLLGLAIHHFKSG